QRDQKAEHRQTRDRLHDVGKTDEPRTEPPPAIRDDAERHADGDCDARRGNDQCQMPRQRGEKISPVVQPEFEQPHCGRGIDVTVSSSIRTSGLVERTISAGVVIAASLPAASTPILVLSVKASPISCVTMTTVLRIVS